MRFRLRYLKHDLELTVGVFVIGRSPECQLSLDDPLVSRRHALLKVSENDVVVEDSGSRNGVVVNGTRIDRPTRLADGDRIQIGGQEMFFASHADDDRRRSWSHPHVGAVTLMTMPVHSTSREVSSPTPAEPTPEAFSVLGSNRIEGVEDERTIDRGRRGESLKLLGNVAEKALALGNPEGAERLLQGGLHETMAELRAGRPVSAEMLDTAARFAARLASGTGKGSWGDFAVEIYARREALPPAVVIDELYVAVRKMRGFDLPALRTYLTGLQRRLQDLTPTERFLLQRLEGLERIAASR